MAATDGFQERLTHSVLVRVAAILILLSTLLNTVTEHYSVGRWGDLFLPSAAFFLLSTGIVFLVIGLTVGASQSGVRRWVMLALVISAPLTSVHAIVFATATLTRTGADRYGECATLIEQATSTVAVPESPALPGRPAIGCETERFGMFLVPYNVLSVYGVIDSTKQDLILKALSDFRSVARTLPIRVQFYEKENWIQHPGKFGPGWGERGKPEKLLRTATL